MGNIHSCTSKGALLLVAAANGDLGMAQELLAKHPKAASYYNFKDRSSPLLQAAARGHFELVQLILETAVMTEGPERAKKNCIDHANSKRQTALMVACKHGHPDCVEYLVTNGGDPLLTDERRHNTCLHFAALYGHSECVHKLLGSRAAYRVQGRQVPVAQIPCGDDGSSVKFIDRHNGWGLSALHIAVFQGSVSTVRALLRHGADVESVICASKVENSPIRCAVGSNALHIAALTGNIIMAKLILETQESYPGLELRSRTNAAGLKPHDYAQSARNPVLMHLLDERLPVTLLRQIWMNYSLEQSLPPRHQTLGSMLQKLKLMFNLELIAIQRNVSHIQAQHDAAAAQQQQLHDQQHRAGAGQQQLLPGTETAPESAARAGGGALQIAAAAAATHGGGAATASTLVSMLTKPRGMEPANVRLLWSRRQEEITQLLGTVTQLHDNLKALCRRDEPTPGDGPAEAPGGLSRADRAATYEAVLDFILSTLITPRTVSAILHAAKKLVSASVNGTAALTAGGAPLELPPGDSDSQHGLALLSTALRAVETCLQAAVYLTSPAALEEQLGPSGNRPGQPSAASNAGTPGEAGAAADPVVGAAAVGGAAPSEAASGGEGASNAVNGQASAALVSDQMAEPQGHAPAMAAGSGAQGSPRAAALTSSPLAVSGPGLVFPSAAVRGVGDGWPAYATHWSAHLHTLITQLQWDIGVQRHRRRRAHAAAAAARSAAAAAAVVAATTVASAAGTANTNGAVAAGAGNAGAGGAPASAGPQIVTALPLTSSAATGSAVAGLDPAGLTVHVDSASVQRGAVASVATSDGAGAAAPSTANLLRVLNSRRGDAVQDIVTSQSGRTPGALPTLAQSRSDSGVSTPVATASAAAAASGSPNAAAGGAAPDGGAFDDGLLLASPSHPTQTDEIIPLVSGALPPSRTITVSPAAGNARELANAEDHLSTGGAAATSHNNNNNNNNSAGAGNAAGAQQQRGGAKERGKDREGAGGGAGGGDGGLDGPDDSPAASESGSDWSDDDRNVCSICMDLPVAVLVAGCQHGLCVQCAFQLCVKGRELPSCPFCRQKIGGFEAKEMATPPAAAGGGGERNGGGGSAGGGCAVRGFCESRVCSRCVCANVRRPDAVYGGQRYFKKAVLELKSHHETLSR
ncbi:hypothetical protein PLESTB_001105600 [Pleodorina starrii]|uniref:RING-type domain-containing protein n=1 Tax=Pleodorina starrii TaxID=330485 RepID=A0A9W6F5I9_9CHLO|nr:hypothetical protein PLESTM_001340600 [Pleodorina starrii]GLC56446.1 hypothetical protein PLESTB_001105600 [Pleodorina starrii]GLC68946.1 hypothetical protein PLESTF_000761800 [Pleodorina starrii]